MIHPILLNACPADMDIKNAQGIIPERRNQRYPKGLIQSYKISKISVERLDMTKRVPSPLSSAELRKWVSTLKTRCVGCGEPDPVVLLFHHLDRSEKSMSISEMYGRRFTKAEILGEVEKCAVLCRNCHARFHVE